MSPAKPAQEPLVPPEVDLSSLPYMPLYIAKLQRSKAWLICKRRPELAYYLVNLWASAYQSVPAGSIEADDDVLADAAGCVSFEKWVDLKSDLLRGWKLCSDGRYHCAGMTEIVREGWLTVQRNKKRAKSGAAARWGKHEPSVTHASSMPVASSKNAMDGRMDGWKDKHPPKSGAHAPRNGHDPVGAIVSAWDEIKIAAADPAHTPAWTDPRTGPALDAIGGLASLSGLDTAAMRHKHSEFAAAFSRQEH